VRSSSAGFIGPLYTELAEKGAGPLCVPRIAAARNGRTPSIILLVEAQQIVLGQRTCVTGWRASSAGNGASKEEGWVALYRELGERVFRLAHRMTGDADAAQDLVHDTFVIVHDRLDQFRGRGDVTTWIFRIAANLARERARTSKRRGELLEQEWPSMPKHLSDDAGRVEARMVLEEALDQLPEELRITLLLHEVDGYTHTEIGEMTGVAEGSSRARLSRAWAELRKVLNGKV
jgi:RNA polymerase sigma-70 factor (ECF subfamily)